MVNTHHSILDALFNTKASEAIQEGIEIDFRVNDLSMLPFEAADMVVLLSNLLDNAIEANRSYCGSKKIHVIALWKKSFLFSIRNTSNPVRIENNTIQTTKPDPQLHGFGLSNVKLILENIMVISLWIMRTTGFNLLEKFHNNRFCDRKNLLDDKKVDLFANSRYLIYKLSSMGVWIE